MNNAPTAAGRSTSITDLILVRKARIAAYAAITLVLAGVIHVLARLIVAMFLMQWHPNVTFLNLGVVHPDEWKMGYCYAVAIIAFAILVPRLVHTYVKA